MGRQWQLSQQNACALALFSSWRPFDLRMMGKQCVVKHCYGSGASRHHLHNFPTDPVIRRQWVKFVKVGRPAFSEQLVKNDSTLVCEAHFTSGCYSASGPGTGSSRRRLKAGAVPTQHVVVSERDKARCPCPRPARPESAAFTAPQPPPPPARPTSSVSFPGWMHPPTASSSTSFVSPFNVSSQNKYSLFPAVYCDQLKLCQMKRTFPVTELVLY